MQPTIATPDPENTPTRPGTGPSSRVLIALARILRRAELAREMLLVAPDDDALAAAVDHLETIQAIAKAVAT